MNVSVIQKLCAQCQQPFIGGLQKLYCSRACRDRRYKQSGKRHAVNLRFWRSSKGRATSARTISRIRARNCDFVYKDKIAKGCSRCSERRPNTLDYHHLDPKTKDRAISQIAHTTVSLNSLKIEMDKCCLLCANCHRVEEYGAGYRSGANL